MYIFKTPAGCLGIQHANLDKINVEKGKQQLLLKRTHFVVKRNMFLFIQMTSGPWHNGFEQLNQ